MLRKGIGMKQIQILDCTLRDGGRIINCKFPDEKIKAIAKGLQESNIDIVEIGFLRDAEIVTYEGNSTFFTDVGQIKYFLPEKTGGTMFVAFIDYGMYNFNCLKPYDGTSVDGVRVGFTKIDLKNNLDDIKRCLYKVKKLGYRLFIQGVNSLAYSDREMLDLIEVVNEIEPYSFGIVDTYGAMYLEDFVRIYNLVDYNLNRNICIDIHSHNNFQLSFAFAQQAVNMCDNNRRVILDATLDGMGKCAGNLNTELIVDYLNRKKKFNYEFDTLLDIIDEYLYSIKQKITWGYSIPAFLAGIYKAHPNNVIYLTEKFRLDTKGIKSIIAMIDEEKRQRYDYVNIQEIYRDYCAVKVDDKDIQEELKNKFAGRKIMLLVPGYTLVTSKTKIESFIDNHHPIIIAIGFEPKDYGCDYIFYANKRRYKKITERKKGVGYILSSNIDQREPEDYIVDYYKVIEEGNKYFDNSTIMAMNLLKRLGIKELYIAGLDGFDSNGRNFVDDSFYNDRYIGEFDEMNQGLQELLTSFNDHNKNNIKVEFITESRFQKIFEED